MNFLIKIHSLWIFGVFLFFVAFGYLIFKEESELFSPVLGLNIDSETSSTIEGSAVEENPFSYDESFTLEKNFSNRRKFTYITDLKADEILLITTGDVIPSRSVNHISVNKNNFKWAFENVAPLLKSADITFINMEAPLIKNCPLTDEGFIFCGDERHLEGLTFAGVDVVNYANNHMGNYGTEGIDNTKKLLDSAGILSVGLSTGPVYKTVKGVTFAFLAYNSLGVPEPLLSYADKDKMKREISAADKAADVVVVGMQWGEEYTTRITSLQKELAHLAVDSGADLVIGNHPHWIQPMEIYENGVILYAHGNLIFDQMWSTETRQGIIVGFIFKGKKLEDLAFTPVLIEGYGQPIILDGPESEKILNKFYEDTLKLKNTL
ncbi:hypothetical protein A3F07_02620 [candidate division WWE3 bacterium RIFCSPHIGHO2_12_FULL_38_15]|uniref:Capsule synthesis protein CapA domain-containing protein n=1 Tax=candidate division WWE3 bacterium RIFCSPHIGHO2_02_FULL_38_14 TaxID=1802620 RepID=A0A1F4V7G6_UNCKA|nr:MAG: hypothetical protein A2793_02675 [candidate division WWE3 bacterium RIFCSPHIGHO2_01_FULL_38_45]OGC48720.1 MAG: hypothetical protein A3F07_02620 [candidate division WWE3 bacterium RIFCSPHIGHO2_12_FULL_38_15]OGC52645.1 MAG: hypothetical protein A3B64_03925 [candidate division WWE3 bacterium RIFCSPLOWO2_01_FULL_37_24]OGC52920.1 MAG: hypothetical protein A3D91_03130 [candidate division WWE3 bacterium RIFCSPHIGHO2_02_FULL_38_14]HLB51477.1 CapA family protein [Patescibacteria group bacterium]